MNRTTAIVAGLSLVVLVYMVALGGVLGSRNTSSVGVVHSQLLADEASAAAQAAALGQINSDGDGDGDESDDSSDPEQLGDDGSPLRVPLPPNTVVVVFPVSHQQRRRRRRRRRKREKID